MHLRFSGIIYNRHKQYMRQDVMPGRKRIQHYSYALNEQIGRGYSSCVYRGKDQRNNQPVAIKVVDMKMLEDDLHRELLKSEISCLTDLKGSQHILRLFDVFATVNNTYIITELCDGKDLAHLINVKKGLSDQQTIHILKQLISGYLDLFKKNIVHRDLKPANIFFKEGVLKIADFGFAVRADKCSRPFNYNIGSPSYMSPEALRNNSYSFKSDIWSLGVVAFEMLHGRVPWRSQTDQALHRMLMCEPIQSHVMKHRLVNQTIIEFMRRCCDSNILKRITPEELASANWFGTTIPMGISKPPQQHQVVHSQMAISHNSTRVLSGQSHTHPHSSTVVSGVSPGLGTTGLYNLLQKQGTRQSEPPITSSVPSRKPPTGINTSDTSNPSNPEDPKSAESSIIAQIQYCRFMNLIMQEIEQLPDGQPKYDISQYFRNELLQKLALLVRMVSDQQNIFELVGFGELTNSQQWSSIRALVINYSHKYHNAYRGSEPTKFNSSEAPLVAAIKSFDFGSHFSLIDKFVTFYQIKLLEKKIDYNQFGQKSKIDLIMSPPLSSGNAERLKKRMNILGLI